MAQTLKEELKQIIECRCTNGLQFENCVRNCGHGEEPEPQTSVEWLQQSMEMHLSHEQKMQFEGLYQQGKEMHEEQMHKCASFWRGKENDIEKPMFIEYYKETFKK